MFASLTDRRCLRRTAIISKYTRRKTKHMNYIARSACCSLAVCPVSATVEVLVELVNLKQQFSQRHNQLRCHSNSDCSSTLRLSFTPQKVQKSNVISTEHCYSSWIRSIPIVIFQLYFTAYPRHCDSLPLNTDNF